MERYTAGFASRGASSVDLGLGPLTHPFGVRSARASGEIGRHAGFRFLCLTAWGFKSPLAHTHIYIGPAVTVVVAAGLLYVLVSMFWVSRLWGGVLRPDGC